MLDTPPQKALGHEPPERVHRRHAITRQMSGARASFGALVVAVLAVGVAVIAPALGSAATPAPQFTVTHGANRPATGTPKPASGVHAALWANDSIATTTLVGSGLVSFGALAQNCAGWPVVKVLVDGKQVGSDTVTTTQTYGTYPTTVPVGQGTHQVQIQLVNDHFVKSTCDRNVFIASAQFVNASPSLTANVAGAQPGSSNTGVPAGTQLTVSNGDMNITKNGTVINAMDIRGFVRINADDVTIKNSFIRGGIGGPKNLSLVADYWNHTNLLIQDSTLAPSSPSYWIDGMHGSNFTLNRVNIYNVVDSLQVINGGHGTVTNSWLHGNIHYTYDPLQPDGKSHDDNIQVQGGSNTVITGNTLGGAFNSAIMVTGATSQIKGLVVKDNWLSGGACTVNVAQLGSGAPILGMSITGNRFGPGRYGTTCPMLVPGTSPISISGNVWNGTSTPAIPRNR